MKTQKYSVNLKGSQKKKVIFIDTVGFTENTFDKTQIYNWRTGNANKIELKIVNNINLDKREKEYKIPYLLSSLIPNISFPTFY